MYIGNGQCCNKLVICTLSCHYLQGAEEALDLPEFGVSEKRTERYVDSKEFCTTFCFAYTLSLLALSL